MKEMNRLVLVSCLLNILVMCTQASLLFDNVLNTDRMNISSVSSSLEKRFGSGYEKVATENLVPSKTHKCLLGSHMSADIMEDRLCQHLRYLMVSTAEQPEDSGGRKSGFSVWLTVLIAALAAALLS